MCFVLLNELRKFIGLLCFFVVFSFCIRYLVWFGYVNLQYYTHDNQYDDKIHAKNVTHAAPSNLIKMPL
jgi:hypothetical protein